METIHKIPRLPKHRFGNRGIMEKPEKLDRAR